jgi:hypothetical protein
VADPLSTVSGRIRRGRTHGSPSRHLYSWSGQVRPWWPRTRDGGSPKPGSGWRSQSSSLYEGLAFSVGARIYRQIESGVREPERADPGASLIRLGDVLLVLLGAVVSLMVFKPL